MHMTKRAVIYMRVHQAERCDDSEPAKQFRTGSEYCLRRGYEIAGGFCDTSTDSVSQEAVLNELREFMRLRGVNVVVVKSAAELPHSQWTEVAGSKWSMFGVRVEFSWSAREPHA